MFLNSIREEGTRFFLDLNLTWFKRTVTVQVPRRAEDRLCGLETYWRNQYAGASCAS